MNTDAIKKISRARYQYQLAKIAARENHTSQLLITTDGSTVRVTAELIAFLSIELLGDQVVVLDIYDNPIRVDRQRLLEHATQTYTSVMNSWADTVQTINKQR
jgi:hypothetical protein